jgi:hypothetical protein
MLIHSRINTNLLTSNKLLFSVSRIPIGIHLTHILDCSVFIYLTRSGRMKQFTITVILCNPPTETADGR